MALVGHLGGRPGESVGTINYYRAKGREEFDDERAFLLQALHPILTSAARRILLRSVNECVGEETALLNASGQFLWMTDGFRFLWNAVNPRPIRHEGLSPGTLLAGDATPLERAAAFHVILLDQGVSRSRRGPGPGPGPERVLPVRGDGPGSNLTVRFDPVPGQSIGYVGQLLRVCLERDRQASS